MDCEPADETDQEVREMKKISMMVIFVLFAFTMAIVPHKKVEAKKKCWYGKYWEYKKTAKKSIKIKGKKLTSEKLAEKMADLALEGHSTIDFIIGGSLGLSAEVSGRADYKLSFSDMTFPHQMMRVILLEQIYRSYKIQRGEPYHK